MAFSTEIGLDPDHPGCSFAEVDRQPISAFAAFYEDMVHSGCSGALVEGGGWDTYKLAEQRRRAKHQLVMTSLFGSDTFEDQAIRVDLKRDPQSGLEQIVFEVKYRYS